MPTAEDSADETLVADQPEEATSQGVEPADDAPTIAIVDDPAPAQPEVAARPATLRESASAAASRALGSESDTAASFLESVMPILRIPILGRALLTAALATAISLAAACLVALLISLASFGNIHALDSVTALWHSGWLFFFVEHQVPIVGSSMVLASAPLLLIVVPVVAMWGADRIAAGIKPVEQASQRMLPFAVGGMYATIALILSAFGPDGVGIAWFRCIVFTFAIATLTLRFAHRRAAAPTTADDIKASQGWRAFMRRAGGFLRAPGVILIAAIMLCTVVTLAANIINDLSSGYDKRQSIVTDVLYAPDLGTVTFAQGMLVAARSSDNSGSGESGTSGNSANSVSRRLWNGRKGSISVMGTGFYMDVNVAGLKLVPFLLVVVIGFATVLIAGLYTGFRLVRNSGIIASRNDALVAGSLTGPVWAGYFLLASLVIIDRADYPAFSNSATTVLADGIELFFLPLVIGAVLGAAGGLIAWRAGNVPATLPADAVA